jgi:predicted dehydrogenase
MKKRLLISGPGLIGKTHARLVQSRDDCELIAVVAPDSNENVEFAKSISVPIFFDFAQAVEKTAPDGVIVSSPNHFHYEQGSLCLRRGIPVLVEKPVTDDIEEAEKLAELVERTGVSLLVGHHRTYSPLIEVILGFLSSNRFGRIVALQGSALFMKPNHYFDDGPWRKIKGGGPILINLIHEIGLMRTFAGEIGAVQALARNNQRGFEVEDTVAINLEFANGALGTFLLSDIAASSKSWEMTAGENPAYPSFPDEACYHLAGTMGSIDFPSMTVRSYPDEQGRSWWKPFEHDRLTVHRANPLALQLSHFLDVIRGTTKPRVSAFDGYQNMRVIQAVRSSIETGKLTAVR